MIVWLSVVGAIVATAIASIRMWGRRTSRMTRRDDWGEWPPDQMAR
jgi:hypothetical protein